MHQAKVTLSSGRLKSGLPALAVTAALSLGLLAQVTSAGNASTPAGPGWAASDGIVNQSANTQIFEKKKKKKDKRTLRGTRGGGGSFTDG